MTPGPDATAELRRKERLGYIILQHVHTLSAEPSLSLLPENIAAALAITRGEVLEIVAKLAEQGYVTWGSPGDAVKLTAGGEDYLTRGAARRKSVRFRWIRRPSSPAVEDSPAAADPPASTGESSGVEGTIGARPKSVEGPQRGPRKRD